MASQIGSHGRFSDAEIAPDAETEQPFADAWITPGGIPVSFRAEPFLPGML